MLLVPLKNKTETLWILIAATKIKMWPFDWLISFYSPINVTFTISIHKYDNVYGSFREWEHIPEQHFAVNSWRIGIRPLEELSRERYERKWILSQWCVIYTDTFPGDGHKGSLGKKISLWGRARLRYKRDHGVAMGKAYLNIQSIEARVTSPWWETGRLFKIHV